MALDEDKSNVYWEGVRDALRLILEFNEWKTTNPETDRTLQDFILAAQDKVAGKIKPKLADLLGVPFK